MIKNLLAAVDPYTPPGGDGGSILNPIFKGSPLDSLQKDSSGVSFFAKLLPSLIGLILVVGSIIFFFMLLWGGIQWLSSGGDKGALESAKGRITNALVGLVILFSAFAIIKLVETFFGVSILIIDIGPLVIQ